MKLIEDDGELICELDDDVCVLLLSDEMEPHVIMQAMDDEVSVPPHVMMMSALMIFLGDKDNVAMLMDLIPNRRKSN